MTERQSSQHVYDTASEWAAKVDASLLTQDEQMALDAWLAADVRHFGAFAQASAHLTPIAASHELRADVWSPRLTRRRVVLGGTIAAGVASLMVASPFVARYFRAGRYATRVGEIQVLPLGDGSVISLNTDSEVVVRYSDQRRDIDLVRGEALFDVAKNKARPFVVHAGDTAVRAIGTSFSVRLLSARPVLVLVREGVVEVSRPNDPVAPVLRIVKDTQAMAPPDAPIEAKPVQLAEVERALAWKHGQIAFHGETLAAAAEEFSRYSDIHIRIDDPAIGREKITGLFQAGDPIGFSRAVAVSFDLHVQVIDDEVRISRD
jgi:transmembrane sensor